MRERLEVHNIERNKEDNEKNENSQKTKRINTKKLSKNNISDRKTSMLNQNEFDIFGCSVAAQLKNMPLVTALQCQMYIQNYLSNIRIKQLENDSQIIVQSPTPSSIQEHFISDQPQSISSTFVEFPVIKVENDL